MTLSIEELVVTSFETTFGTEPGRSLPTDDPDTNEPTPGTRCYDCP